jgi:rhomboid protease GluP
MESVDFQEALDRQTPRVWVTPTLIAANIIVFAVMAAKGVNPVSPTGESVIPWGADYGPLTLRGEWWRLLASTFIHFGFLHLLMNMFVLWGIGRLVERLYGNVPFLVLYLCAGLAGSVASTAWNPLHVSAGASGAVFGVYGALGAYLLRRRDVIPRATVRGLWQTTAMFVLFNVLFGFRVQGIDNSAHLGGLAGGFVLGLIQASPLGASLASRLARSALVVVLAAGASFGILRDRAAPPDVFGPARAAIALYNEVDALDQRARDRVRGLAEDGRGTDDTMANVIENEILPEYAELRRRIEALEPNIPALRYQPPLVAKYLHAEEAAWRRIVEGLRAHDRKKVDQGFAELDKAGDLFGAKP